MTAIAAVIIAGGLALLLDAVIPPGSIPLDISAPPDRSPAPSCCSWPPSSAAPSPSAGSCAWTRPQRSEPSHDRHPGAARRPQGVRGRRHEVVALDHAELTIEPGEIVALVGPSGSGQDDAVLHRRGPPDADVGHRRSSAARTSPDYSSKQLTAFRQQKVGFVFQAVNLVPFLTARENLLVVDELGRRTGAAARARADELLDDLGLTDRAQNLPGPALGRPTPARRHRADR